MSTFQERQQSLFDQLKEAEKQHTITKENSVDFKPNDGVIDSQTYKKVKSEMKYLRGQESIFKRPHAPISRCLKARTVPDYIKNPQKWVHYSLADVTEEQMSEASNRASAMASMRAVEDKDVKSMEVDDETIFKKPKFHMSASFKKQMPMKDKSMFKSSKVIMPEYVVGAAKNKIRNKTQTKKIIPKEIVDKDNKAELKLQHLYEEEE